MNKTFGVACVALVIASGIAYGAESDDVNITIPPNVTLTAKDKADLAAKGIEVFTQHFGVAPPKLEVAPKAADAAPSWQAICGYRWRMYQQATGAKGRDAHTAFMHVPVAQGGCGAKDKTRDDTAIQAWIAAHPAQ